MKITYSVIRYIIAKGIIPMNKVELLKLLGKHKHILSRQELRTIKGQVLAGEYEGALRGIMTILRRKNIYIDNEKLEHRYEKQGVNCHALET